LGQAIVRFKPEIIVIACNTASVIALDHLRKEFNVDFVGTVPALKPAALKSTSKEIAVLATTRTIQDQYLENLISKYAQEKVVHRLASAQLADLIEQTIMDPSAINEKHLTDHLNELLQAISESKTDSLVLGCTHFIHAKERISQILGDRVTIHDSRLGITKQMNRIALALDEQDEIDSNSTLENEKPKECLDLTTIKINLLVDSSKPKNQINLLLKNC
jgi:glutamate racemase